jgi:hypothetical protein
MCDRLAAELRSVGRHNEDVAWWQPSEPREKIIVSTLSTLLGGLSSCNTSLYLLLYIYRTCVVALILVCLCSLLVVFLLV